MPDISLTTIPFGVSNPTCTDCEYHETAMSVCVPGRKWDPPTRSPGDLDADNKGRWGDIALFIIGEKPGREEDEQNECFVGEAGGYLDAVYLDEFQLHELADVYLSNVVRCKPPGKASPNKKHTTPCSKYWQEELRWLTDRYPRVVVLCAGTTASQVLIRMKATTAFRHQGLRAALLPGDPRTFEVYATYHPAFLMPGRNPNAVVTVNEHLHLLKKALVEPSPAELDIPYTVAPEPEPYTDNLLAVDTETYGLFRDAPNQTQFNPQRAMSVDSVPPDRLIRLISVAWRTPAGDVRAGLFLRHRRAHMAVLYRWLGALRRAHGTMLCMNTLFDATWLRASDPMLRLGALARPTRADRGIQLADLAIRNYQHAEDRPERSLKSLSNLFRMGVYDPEFRAERVFETAMDRASWQYCCNDAGRTLKLWHYLADRIREDFPAEIAARKLSTETHGAYSERLWSLVTMSESGCSLSASQLAGVRVETEAAITDLESRAGGPLSGKDSQKWEMDLMARCTEIAVPEDLRLSKVTGQLRANKTNVVAMLDVLPDGPERTQLELLTEHRKHQKMLGSYLRPMLDGYVRKRIRYAAFLRDGLCHPTWYPVPSTEHDDSGDEGGTNQGRLSCKKPALQTLPPRVKKCLQSRWPDGILLWVDLSQIELRIAALLSGDREMTTAYCEGRDLHTELTAAIFGGPALYTEEEWRGHYRQVGKQANFLLIYRGGASRLRQQLREKAGITMSLGECDEILASGWKARQGLHAHQDRMIAEVKRDGYHARPIYGDSRWFCGGDVAVVETYERIICNFPVQYEAVMAMLDVQAAMDRWMTLHRTRSVICLQWHDAIIIDCRPDEIDDVESKLRDVLATPTYYNRLCDHLGRTVPLGYEITRIPNKEIQL